MYEIGNHEIYQNLMIYTLQMVKHRPLLPPNQPHNRTRKVGGGGEREKLAHPSKKPLSTPRYPKFFGGRGW